MAKTRQVGFRLPEEEYARLANVHERAKQRTLGNAPFGDVVREALGLIPMKIITPQERDYIAGLLDTLPEGDDGPESGMLDKAHPGKVIGRGKKHHTTA